MILKNEDHNKEGNPFLILLPLRSLILFRTPWLKNVEICPGSDTLLEVKQYLWISSAQDTVSVLSPGFAISSQICRSNRKVSKARQTVLGYFCYIQFPCSWSKYSVPSKSDQIEMQVKTELEVSTRQAWNSVLCLMPFVLPCFISKSEQPFVHTHTRRCKCKARRSHLFLTSLKPQGKTQGGYCAGQWGNSSQEAPGQWGL